MTVPLVLASVALAVALTTAGVVAWVVVQNGTTTTELRAHRRAHERTHGRPDPDPEHHGTSPTVQRLARELQATRQDLETLGGLYEQLTLWADGAERRLGPPADERMPHDPRPGATAATAVMPTSDRPRPAPRS